MQGPGIYDGVAPSRGITPGRGFGNLPSIYPTGYNRAGRPREIRVSLTTDTSLVKRSMAAIAVIGVLLLAACSSGTATTGARSSTASLLCLWAP